MTEAYPLQWPAVMVDRFWRYVDKRGPDECWPWLGRRTEDGYGQFFFSMAPNKRTSTTASRQAFILENGPLADDEFALHSCDNPPCCNPAHLFKGNGTENNLDCATKGRRPAKYGPHNRLSDDDVRQIRELRRGGVKLKEIGELFGGLSATRICAIAKGRARSSVPFGHS